MTKYSAIQCSMALDKCYEIQEKLHPNYGSGEDNQWIMHIKLPCPPDKPGGQV